MPKVTGGKVRCEVADKSIERSLAEELDSVLPLSCGDKIWVGNDLKTR
jgi:hypothetical protein